MNLKASLFFNEPIVFKNVCKIYPITVPQSLSYDKDEFFYQNFTPFMLSKEAMGLNGDIKIFDVIFATNEMLAKLIGMLSILFRTEDIKLDFENGSLIINEKLILNRDNFDELADIVLEMIQCKRFEKPKDEIPKFESEEGKQRWLELQKLRKKNEEKERAKALNLLDITNIVQFGMGAYIPDTELKNMTLWKLLKSFKTISNKSNYNYSFEIFCQSGEKSLIEKHWQEESQL